MKNRILMTLALVATLLTFSNFVSVPATTPSNSAPTKEETKAAKKAEKMEKFLNSKTGQWLIKRAEKQAIKKQENLAKQLVKAEAKNDVEKIQKIKEKQKANDLGDTGRKLMIAGGITLLVGIVIWYLVSLTVGSLLWSLGGLVLTIGFVLWLVDMVSK
jgi:Flp pilus assembly protein TadB